MTAVGRPTRHTDAIAASVRVQRAAGRAAQAIGDSHDEGRAARRDRRDGRAGDPQPRERSESEDEHRIEHERDRDRGEQQHERRSRVARRAKRRIDREEAVDQRRAEEKRPEIDGAERGHLGASVPMSANSDGRSCTPDRANDDAEQRRRTPARRRRGAPPRLRDVRHDAAPQPP